MSSEPEAAPGRPLLEDAEAYIRRMDEVQGWFSEGAAHTFCLIQDLQRRHGVEGDIVEIGVHHGRSALLMSCFVDLEREWLYLNDIFEDQAANLSRSGAGDRDAFLTHLRRLRPGFDRYTILQKPSSELSASDIGTSCRFFHIDGGHSSAETEGDLSTAARSLHPDGVIVIDDYFNQEFPSVSEGVNRFLLRNGGIQPFLICFNKMYFCRTASAELYSPDSFDADRMADCDLQPYAREFYGRDVLLLAEIPRQRELMKLDIRLPLDRLQCRAGETIAVNLLVRNSGAGDITHVRGSDVQLDYHLYGDGGVLRWDNVRVPLAPLPRGEQRLVEYRLRAPEKPGDYVCEFDGVIENVTWLKDVGGATQRLSLSVRP
ncbi:MAG: class I SAM-dependent methyltransferase [Thermoanaerobaculia bacterium]